MIPLTLTRRKEAEADRCCKPMKRHGATNHVYTPAIQTLTHKINAIVIVKCTAHNDTVITTIRLDETVTHTHMHTCRSRMCPVLSTVISVCGSEIKTLASSSSLSRVVSLYFTTYMKLCVRVCVCVSARTVAC